MVVGSTCSNMLNLKGPCTAEDGAWRPSLVAAPSQMCAAVGQSRMKAFGSGGDRDPQPTPPSGRAQPKSWVEQQRPPQPTLLVLFVTHVLKG